MSDLETFVAGVGMGVFATTAVAFFEYYARTVLAYQRKWGETQGATNQASVINQEVISNSHNRGTTGIYSTKRWEDDDGVLTPKRGIN